MAKKEEIKSLLKARANLYRFLGSLYIMEVDEDALADMKKMQFPKNLPESNLSEAYKMISEYIAACTNDDLDDLAADYAKTFLAAGEASGQAAFPYESIYVSKKHEIGGRTEQETLALYALHGWEPSKNMYRTMNDHIGLELEFMAVLCEEQLLACNTNNSNRAAMSLGEQKEFLETHLRWAGAFCMDVNKFAQTTFYQGIAKLTSEFLAQEKELLAMGGAIWDIA